MNKTYFEVIAESINAVAGAIYPFRARGAPGAMGDGSHVASLTEAVMDCANVMYKGVSMSLDGISESIDKHAEAMTKVAEAIDRIADNMDNG